MTTRRTRLTRGLSGLLMVGALTLTACGGSVDATDDDPAAPDDRASSATDDDSSAESASESDGTDDGTGEGGGDEGAEGGQGGDEAGAADGAGILVADTPTRFSEADWLVVSSERRPDGPGDDGQDVDPSEDFVEVELDVASTVQDTTFSLPVEWVVLADAGGRTVRPALVVDRDTGDRLNPYVVVAPNRTERLRISYAVDAATDYTGGWIALDAGPDHLQAATAGPRAVDESERLPVTFDTTTYDGPFSRDEATVEIVEAHWSRELGQTANGALIDSVEHFSRRPTAGEAFLLVHFEVTCRLTGINTGGCNVSSGQVEVDGARRRGSVVNGLSGYDSTAGYWASYPVPVDADEVRLHIGSGEGVETDFVVADLEPLRSLATPTG